jgi:predicted small integral membrane protein
MKRILLLSICTIFLLSSCNNTKTPKTNPEDLWTFSWEIYTATHEYLTDISWNWEIIKVYKWEELVFTKEPEDGLGNYENIVGDKLFVSYWTAPIWRNLKIFKIPNWELLWEKNYNTPLNIDETNKVINLQAVKNITPSQDACENYEEINTQAKQLGMSVEVVQDVSYNFESNTETELSQVYCSIGQ